MNNHTPEKSADRKLDAEYFSDYCKYGNVQAEIQLDGDKNLYALQKGAFINGEIENPTLATTINLDKIDSDRKNLLKLKQKVQKEENESIKNAYTWKINEKLALQDMLVASAHGDMHKFKRYNEFIYGKPSQEIFDYTIESIRKITKKNLESDNLDIRQSAFDLLDTLPKIETSRIDSAPSAETFNFAKEVTLKKFGELAIVKSSDKELSAEEMRDYFEIAIDKIGAGDAWKATVDRETSIASISVNYERQLLKVSSERHAKESAMAKLALHEVGTHIARFNNGKNSNLELLSLGLDRYEPGDEGLATMREQVTRTKFSTFSGKDAMLSIGLCYGLDGQKRDFRQVYEIIKKYFYHLELKKTKDITHSNEHAVNSAWDRSVRTFRGTDCKTPGVCLMKDLSYRKGNIGIWETLKNNPDEICNFDIGKYDPNNQRHIKILNDLGLFDKSEA